MMYRKSEWSGNEFKENDLATHNGTTVTILSWSNECGGWWYVKLPNGGYHYTRNIQPIKR